MRLGSPQGAAGVPPSTQQVTDPMFHVTVTFYIPKIVYGQRNKM